MSAQGKDKEFEMEKTLPPGFEARSDIKAGKVELSRSGKSRPVSVAINSYASVADVLARLWPDGDASLEPGSTLVLEDTFTGRRAAVAAFALPDVAAVLNGLVAKPGKHVPKKQDAEAGGKVDAPETPEEEAGSGLPEMPEWLKAHGAREDTDDGAGGEMELERMPLALGQDGHKEVLGRAKGGEAHVAWGYEVRVDGERVAWLVAKPKAGFVITGVKAFDYKPTEHRVLGGAIARLQAIIVPKHRAAGKEAA